MCNDCSGDDRGMTDRRGFMRLGLLATGAMAAQAFATGAMADECVAFDAGMQQAITPHEAVAKLMAGNARFLAAASVDCDLLAEAAATAEKQTPFACVLGCMDSRAAPELIFDQQIGDIFVARVAGNLATPEIIGSFEYGTKVAGAKAIIVLGHTHCGAIKGAIDKAEVGPNLTTLLNEIEPLVEAAHHEGERSSHNHHLVEAVAEANTRAAAARLVAASPVLAELVAAEQLMVVPAIYDIDTRAVRLLT
jgi:carbonic anhydrase